MQVRAWRVRLAFAETPVGVLATASCPRGVRRRAWTEQEHQRGGEEQEDEEDGDLIGWEGGEHLSDSGASCVSNLLNYTHGVGESQDAIKSPPIG